LLVGLDTRQRWAVLGIAIGALAVVGWVGSNYMNRPKEFDIVEQRGQAIDAGAPVTIDVSGEVADPGLYTLDGGSRVADAIEDAGGATRAGDLDKLNLAAILLDGTKLVVPKAGTSEYGGMYSGSSGPDPQGASFVSINTAGLAELDTLPGIGPVKAQAIIDYRDRIGGVRTLEEIKGVRGIGEKTFQKLLPLIRL